MTRKQIAQRANSPVLTLVMLVFIGWLGFYSYAKTHEHGYDQRAVDRVSELSVMGDGTVPHSGAKAGIDHPASPAMSRKNAQLMVELYGDDGRPM